MLGPICDQYVKQESEKCFAFIIFSISGVA